MNLPPVIGAYAALRRAEGQPFHSVGADWVWEAVDVRLVADACVWATGHPNAVNQTFNLLVKFFSGEIFGQRFQRTGYRHGQTAARPRNLLLGSD